MGLDEVFVKIIFTFVHCPNRGQENILPFEGVDSIGTWNKKKKLKSGFSNDELTEVGI